MKMLLQTLWLHKLTWNEAFPDDAKRRWDVIVKTLPLLITYSFQDQFQSFLIKIKAPCVYGRI